jgi:hypothetical protein
MWMLLVLAGALGLGLTTGVPERTARLAVVFLVIVVAVYEALRYGLI